MNFGVAFVFIALAGVVSAVPVPDDCPEFCPQFIKPICGSDGIETMTFDNDCQMLQFSCLKSRKFNLLRTGDCDRPEPSGIQAIIPGLIPGLPDCPEDLELVCGSDGLETKTFPNKCIMDVISSLENKDFVVTHSGEC